MATPQPDPEFLKCDAEGGDSQSRSSTMTPPTVALLGRNDEPADGVEKHRG
jgi:hypothetical protein